MVLLSIGKTENEVDCWLSSSAQMWSYNSVSLPYHFHVCALQRAQCECQHNTCGSNCDRCCPLYNQLPWRAGTPSDGAQCEPCQCYGHATSCYYNATIAAAHLSRDVYGEYRGGGVCINCTVSLSYEVTSYLWLLYFTKWMIMLYLLCIYMIQYMCRHSTLLVHCIKFGTYRNCKITVMKWRWRIECFFANCFCD
jgi:hypothetical protein